MTHPIVFNDSPSVGSPLADSPSAGSPLADSPSAGSPLADSPSGTTDAMVIRPSCLDSGFVSSPVLVSTTSPSPGGGQSSSVPTRETGLLGSSASPGPLSSSAAQLDLATSVEEGWIAVMRKKSKPSLPPLDMFLRSGKGNSKSKGTVP